MGNNSNLATGFLNLAHQWAKIHSGCRKVQVGAVIVKDEFHVVALGANRAIPNLCKASQCRRIQLYGDDSKNHRNPEDCRAIS